MSFTKYLIFGFVMLLFFPAPKVHAQFSKVLIPQDVTLQHAGSNGFMSAGFGYNFFKNKRGHLDLGYGFVPEKRGGELHILSLKFNYRPWEIHITDGIKLYPANPGAFVTYHLGPQFDFYWDKDTYEDGYYWWSTALRPHLSLSTEFNFDMKKLFKTDKIKNISVYSEFNTNELYLVSYFQNAGTLNLTEIFKLGVGIRVHL
ncbi:hypothetical protein [Pedobacter sp.]|uniref:hypothetical protein n=1 Tax=Pedobacter sp. TaxID=1411316 RepID=UPI003D7F3CAA